MTKLNKYLETIRDKWLQIDKNNKYYIYAFIIISIFSVWNELRNSSSGAKTQPNTNNQIEIQDSIDTYIPKGYVLIPIDLVNRESIVSIIDQTSLVDLYYQKKSLSKSIKIASRVKLIRAPLNPNQLAVLISEDDSHQILTYEGPYFAVIQNKREKALGLLHAGKNVNIIYQN